MLNFYKYQYFIQLENKYQNYFKFAENIKLLPPILKKVGVIYYLAFMVINSGNNIKRPIGVILVNKVTGQEKVYDMIDYEFCPAYPDFDNVYYSTLLTPFYYPNNTPENEEYFKVSLDKLAIASNNKFFNIDNNEYQKYLSRIKNLFPSNYFVFFEDLQKNEIIPINEKIKAKRDLSKIKNSINKNIDNKQKIIENTINKRIFKKQFRKEITKYINQNILPNLKGNGSFNKLIFYNKFGKYYKDFEKNITSHYNCYGFEIDDETKDKNIISCIENEELEIKRIYKNNLDSNFINDIQVDTLGRVIIVFLNSLLIEEIHNAVLPKFEAQIEECIETLNYNLNKDINEVAKQFLYNIYYELLNDYNTVSNESLSNTYYGYLIIHFPFDM